MASRRIGTRVGVSLVTLALLLWGVSVVDGAAGRTGLRVLCSSIDAVCQQWATGFAQRTGIDVLMERLPTGEALTRLSAPGAAGEFDVWHGGPADAYVLAASRGLLTGYVSPEASAIPDEFKDAGGTWTGTYLGVLGFCSNRGLLARLGVPVPESWDDLIDPRLRGLVSAPNPVTSGTGYVWLRTQVLRLGEDPAFAYVRDLDANVRQYTTSGLAPAGIAGRGEAAVAVTFTQHCVRAANAGMTDLVVSHPREGSGTEIGSVAILAGAQAPAAARSYVDWALSWGAQAGEPGRPVDQLPTRRDVVGDQRLGGNRLFGSDPVEAAADRDQLIERFQDEVRR